MYLLWGKKMKITDNDLKKATEKKNGILKGNMNRLDELRKEQVLIALDYQKKKLSKGAFTQKMLRIRNEIKEIKKRNFGLVQEWITIDDRYQDQHPEKYLKPTIEELKEKLKDKNIEVEKWRTEV